MAGVLLLAAAGALAFRAFHQNNSMFCGLASPVVGTGACSHYSYAMPAGLGIASILLVMGGGAFASHYAMGNVGVPLIAAPRKHASTR